MTVSPPGSPVETVQRMLDAFMGERPQEAFELIDPAIEFDVRQLFADGQIYHGHEGVLEFFMLWLGTWQDYEAEPLEITAVGDSHVVVLMRERGRGDESGARVEWQFGQLWKVRDGQVVALCIYRTKEEALAAAGAAERRPGGAGR